MYFAFGFSVELEINDRMNAHGSVIVTPMTGINFPGRKPSLPPLSVNDSSLEMESPIESLHQRISVSIKTQSLPKI